LRVATTATWKEAINHPPAPRIQRPMPSRRRSRSLECIRFRAHADPLRHGCVNGVPASTRFGRELVNLRRAGRMRQQLRVRARTQIRACCESRGNELSVADGGGAGRLPSPTDARVTTARTVRCARGYDLVHFSTGPLPSCWRLRLLLSSTV